MPLINCVTARKLPNLCASISSSVFTIITHGQHLDMLPVITFIIITDSRFLCFSDLSVIYTCGVFTVPIIQVTVVCKPTFQPQVS